jgi:hypothetical protein
MDPPAGSQMTGLLGDLLLMLFCAGASAMFVIVFFG